MAQTNFTPISLYYSSTSTNVPTAGNLVAGELAINTADGKLFYKDSSGVVQVIGTKGGVGSSTTTQVLYNSSGLVVGSANMTFSGTALTLANDASISGLTVGKGGGAVSTATAIGNGALNATNTGANNSAFGYQANYNTTSGTDNTVGGASAGTNIQTGSRNTIYGSQAAGATSSGYSDATAIGYKALYNNGSGQYNIAIGGNSLYNNGSGANNVGIGYQALYSNTTGAQNTAVSYQAGGAITTGTYNIMIGFQAGNQGTNNLTTGSRNYLIGDYSYTSGATATDQIVIGYNSGGKGNSTGFINPNSGGVYQGNNSTLWSITSDVRLKKNIVDNTDGLNKITAIQVRNFEYRTADEVTELEPQNAINIKGVQLGAIAQELQAILPDCVKTESTGVMSVDASNLTWYLINAVKELNAKITALENK